MFLAFSPIGFNSLGPLPQVLVPRWLPCSRRVGVSLSLSDDQLPPLAWFEWVKTVDEYALFLWPVPQFFLLRQLGPARAAVELLHNSSNTVDAEIYQQDCSQSILSNMSCCLGSHFCCQYRSIRLERSKSSDV